MKETQELDNFTSFVEENFSLLSLHNDRNDVTDNETKGGIRHISLSKNGKKERKKRVVFATLEVKNVQTNVKPNIPNNKTSSLHITNNEDLNKVSISPETVLSSTSTAKHNDAGDTSDKSNSTSTLSNLLEENTWETPSVKKKKDRKANVTASNPIEKAYPLLHVNKQDGDNVSVLPKTADLRNTSTVERNNEDKSDKSISILQNLSVGETQKSLVGKKKKRGRKRKNYLRKKNAQTDIKLNDLNDKDCTSQVVNNEDCNNLPSTSTAECRSSEDITDKDISIFQNSRSIFNIDYEFHEANHAIIDTFALNIYFSLCTDDRKTFCLVCDKPVQIESGNLREHLYKHIQSKKHVELLSQMIEDNKKSARDGKLFSKLQLARECMKRRNDFVECLLCDSKNFSSKIQNDDESLQKHITDSKHQNSKVSWTSPVKNILQYIHNRFRSKYDARQYYCEFCNYESSSEVYFLKHLRVPYHMTRLAEIPDHAERFKFHFCDACLHLWFGSSEMYDRHCEQMEHRFRITYGSDLNYLPEQVVQLLITPKENVEALLEKSNYVCYDQTINYVLYNLVTDLQRYNSNIKAYPFGSRISNLGFPDSDIDIFLDCDNMYEGRKSSYRHCQALIVLIVSYLSLNKLSWKVQEMILHSRTPIVKMQHIPSGLICDISVSNGLAVENTKIIKCFNHAFPSCRKMILFLKRWLHLCNLLGKHLITSYAITWCVIFYLQTLLVFPSISELIKLRNSSWRISGWEVGISYNFPVRKVDYTFEELLLGFFIFYANFEYKSRIVCPLLGRPIEKDAFNNLSKLPQDMAPYIDYMNDTCAEEEPLSQAFSISPLCVQDPFDLSHNLTKAVHNHKLNKLQTYCTYSARILKKSIPYLKPPL